MPGAKIPLRWGVGRCSLVHFGRAFVFVYEHVFVSVIVHVCMRVSPLHFVHIVQVGNKRFREFEKTSYGQTKTGGRINGPTDGWTDGRMDGQTLL